MRTRSPVRSSARPPPAAASGEAFRIEGERGGPRLPAIAHARQIVDPFPDQVRRGAHVDDFRRARITDRPRAAHEQDGAIVDLQRRIIDARVIILRPIEHHGPSFERLGIRRIGQIARPEILADHTGLHDGGIEQVAPQHGEARLFLQRPAEGPDDPLILDPRVAAILTDGLAVDRQRRLIDQTPPA